MDVREEDVTDPERQVDEREDSPFIVLKNKYPLLHIM